MEMIVKTKDLCKEYHGKLAVNNISLEIPKGVIFGLVGKNGAGKTTLIRLLSGLINKTSGEYELFGVKDNDKNIYTIRSKMSAIVETPSIYLNMNGYDNLLTQEKLLGIKDEKLIKGILEEVKLPSDKYDHKKAKDYSLGMRQRLGIAMTLIGNPELLILDEPTNGLDPEGIMEIRNLLLRLCHEKKITIIISSHILSELSKLADWYAFIDDGKVIQEISAEELQKHSRSNTTIGVDNISSTQEILNEMGINNYEVSSKTEIKIYDEFKIQDLMVKLSEKKVNVFNLRQENEDLEKYFLTLVGGQKND